MSEQNIGSSNFNIPEPTDEEIKVAIQNANKRYGITLLKKDAVRYVKLYRELKQWFWIEKNAHKPGSITGNMAKSMQHYIKEKRKQDIPLKDAKNIAEESLDTTIQVEKERIGLEINKIIEKYKDK
jgi:hypothetical protein